YRPRRRRIGVARAEGCGSSNPFPFPFWSGRRNQTKGHRLVIGPVARWGATFPSSQRTAANWLPWQAMLSPARGCRLRGAPSRTSLGEVIASFVWDGKRKFAPGSLDWSAARRFSIVWRLVFRVSPAQGGARVTKNKAMLLAGLLVAVAYFILQNVDIPELEHLKLRRRGAPVVQQPQERFLAPPVQRTGDTIRIASFNIQVFGE